VLHFASLNINMPMFCMGDMNEIMHGHEKLGPRWVDINHVNAFCAYVKQWVLLIWVTMVLHTLGLTRDLLMFPLMKDLIVV
jgi:hypothetical protein